MLATIKVIFNTIPLHLIHGIHRTNNHLFKKLWHLTDNDLLTLEVILNNINDPQLITEVVESKLALIPTRLFGSLTLSFPTRSNEVGVRCYLIDYFTAPNQLSSLAPELFITLPYTNDEAMAARTAIEMVARLRSYQKVSSVSPVRKFLANFGNPLCDAFGLRDATSGDLVGGNSSVPVRCKEVFNQVGGSQAVNTLLGFWKSLLNEDFPAETINQSAYNLWGLLNATTITDINLSMFVEEGFIASVRRVPDWMFNITPIIRDYVNHPRPVGQSDNSLAVMDDCVNRTKTRSIVFLDVYQRKISLIASQAPFIINPRVLDTTEGVSLRDSLQGHAADLRNTLANITIPLRRPTPSEIDMVFGDGSVPLQAHERERELEAALVTARRTAQTPRSSSEPNLSNIRDDAHFLVREGYVSNKLSLKLSNCYMLHKNNLIQAVDFSSDRIVFYPISKEDGGMVISGRQKTEYFTKDFEIWNPKLGYFNTPLFAFYAKRVGSVNSQLRYKISCHYDCMNIRVHNEALTINNSALRSKFGFPDRYHEYLMYYILHAPAYPTYEVGLEGILSGSTSSVAISEHVALFLMSNRDVLVFVNGLAVGYYCPVSDVIKVPSISILTKYLDDLNLKYIVE